MIKREIYMQRIRPFIDNDLVKIITGIRRCGKSVMLDLIKNELIENGIRESSIISINFESLRFGSLLTAEALYEEISHRAGNVEGKVYLFFDEIQEVEGWEKCINSFRVDLDCDIYITGSNAKLLSGELATYLAGRYVEFIIYPFSFCEFLEGYRQSFPEAAETQAFQEYLLCGGMPYLINVKYEKEAAGQYLTDIFNSVQIKDVIKRNSVRDIDLLDRIMSYIMVNMGTTFSATSISKFLKSENRKTAPETVLNYIDYCCQAFLFYKVKRKDLQGKQVLAANEKYFIADHGIREAVYGNNLRDIERVLENIVYMELLRRGYQVYVGRMEHKEIDFVCEKGADLIYVQVAYLLASEETIRREFGIYEQIKDNFPKYIVSMDEVNMSRNGIIHMNIRDFLLMK